MSETNQCQHPHGGGVSTNFDPYGTRRKLGMEVGDFRRICWVCWDEWGRSLDEKERDKTDAAVRERGLCGFLEAWIGHCFEEAPCAKHQPQKCWQCQGPATRNCSHAASLVCGMPECDEHSHHDHHGG